MAKSLRALKPQKIVGYNTHGHWAPLSEIRQTEVEERGNEFPDNRKYDNTHEAIWVTKHPIQAAAYNFPSVYFDDFMSMKPPVENHRAYGSDPEEHKAVLQAFKHPHDHAEEIDLKGAIPFHEDPDGGVLYIRPTAHHMKRVNPKITTLENLYHAHKHTNPAKAKEISDALDKEYAATRAKLNKSEDLEKMSQPRLQFPKIKGMNTRPDQDVRQIATERQKKIYGKVVAQNQLPDKEENYSTSEYNPETREFTHSPTIKRKVSRQTLRDKYAKRVASRFSRSTLGTSAAASSGGKSFNAALSGAQRTKFEGHEPTAEAKEKHAERHDDYKAKLNEWLKRADELKAVYNQQDNPNGRLAAAHEYNQHIKKRPRRPRKVTVGKKDTRELTPEQQILRGRNVDTTIEHEATHGTFRQLEAKAGKLEARTIRNELVQAIPQETQRHLASFIQKRGYKPKDPHFLEEILTHARDILTSPTKRQAFEAHVGPEKAREQINAIKRAWKEIVTKAKGFSVAGKEDQAPVKVPEAAEKSEPIEKMGLHGNWANEGYTLSHRIEDEPNDDGFQVLTIHAHHPQFGHVGSAHFSLDPKDNSIVQPLSVAVQDEHKRKGLATAMYQHAEKLHGPIDPSSNQTDEGRALWDQPNRPFGKMELDIGAENVKVTVNVGAENVKQYVFQRGDDCLIKSEDAPEEVINLVQNATGVRIG